MDLYHMAVSLRAHRSFVRGDSDDGVVAPAAVLQKPWGTSAPQPGDWSHADIPGSQDGCEAFSAALVMFVYAISRGRSLSSIMRPWPAPWRP